MDVIDYIHQDDDIWVGPWRMDCLKGRRGISNRGFTEEQKSISYLGDRDQHPLFTILRSPKCHRLHVFSNSFGIYPSILIWSDLSCQENLTWTGMRWIGLFCCRCIDMFDYVVLPQTSGNLKLVTELPF